MGNILERAVFSDHQNFDVYFSARFGHREEYVGIFLVGGEFKNFESL